MTEPTHRPLEWSTLEEYEGEPDVLERMGGGDWNTKPKGFADKLENLSIPEMKLRRRSFMKLSGFAAVLAAASGCEKPLEHVLPYVNQPEEITVGIPVHYSSTCNGCGAACGTLIKTREGRPIKLEGNANHKVNQGALCSKGQGSLMGLYDPDRLRRPGRIQNGEFQATGNWNSFDDEIIASLKSSRKTVVLTNTIHGPARNAVLKEFGNTFPNVEHVMYDGHNEDTRRAARQATHSVDVLPQYHFDKAEVTVLLGSDPVVDGYSPIANARGIGEQRKVKGDAHHFTMGKLYAFEPTPSMTGMSADVRQPVRSSELLSLAQAILSELLNQGLGSGIRVSGLPSASNVESQLGLDSGLIAEVADNLAQHQGKSLVFTGGHTSDAEHKLSLHAVVNTINEVLGNEGETITDDQASNQSLGSDEALSSLIEDMKAGRVDVLLLKDANPVYHSAQSADFVSALKNVKTKVSFSTHLDETAKNFDIALPGVHFLENWGDAEPLEGYLSLQQPTIQKLWDNREFEQSLITMANKAGNATLSVEVPPALGSEEPATQRTMHWREFVQKTWETQVYAAGGYAGKFIDFWYAALRSGVLDAPYRIQRRAKNFRVASQLLTQSHSATTDMELVLYSSINLGDGSHANNPFLLELPDPVSRVCWDNYFSIAPETAKAQGLKDGDIVTVNSNGTSVQGPVRRQPGTHPGVLAAAVGWGRTDVGVVGNDVGFNVYPLATNGNFSGSSATLSKTGEKTELADVQGHNYMRKNPEDKDEPKRQIIQATSLSLFNEDARAPQPYYHIPYWNTEQRTPDAWATRYKHTMNGKEYSLSDEKKKKYGDPLDGPNRIEWFTGEHPYVKHKWVMTIDLNACNGCNACVVACSTENNIPVVGKREVLVGREMHWISIHRYYKGKPENPEFVKMPMLCQHCDNAPCETVCPVLATVHSDEGINQQVYNRCVGTRYCANNCPYKVRRFNFYQYTDFRRGPHEQEKVKDTPLALAFNPDITVRTKGIMEKCTFCSNRIRHAKYEAKQKGRDIPNGELQSACQQTCPTHAITFGDAMNDEHDVNKVRKANYNKRGYGVLEEFNVQPNVMYLAHIWNRETKDHDHDYIKKKYGHDDHGDSHGGGHDDGHSDDGHGVHDGHGNDGDHGDDHSSLINKLTNPQGVRS